MKSEKWVLTKTQMRDKNGKNDNDNGNGNRCVCGPYERSNSC